MRAHAASFYNCSAFDSAVKGRTVQPLLLSRLLCNAPTWPPLTTSQQKKLNGTLLKVVQMVASTSKSQYEDPVVNLLALDRVGMLPLDVTMKLQRLSFLPRLMRWAPPFLLALIDETPTFRRDTIDDLAWLATVSPQVAELRT